MHFSCSWGFFMNEYKWVRSISFLQLYLKNMTHIGLIYGMFNEMVNIQWTFNNSSQCRLFNILH